METVTSGDLPKQGRLFIPACGDRIKLAAPWRFTLTLERRNTKLAKALGLIEEDCGNVYSGKAYQSPLSTVKAELPAGDVLECDRVYIRGYNRSRIAESASDPSAIDYDSITWKLFRPKGKKNELKMFGRFWVKLPDAYAIEYELEWDSLYRDRVKLVDQVHNL
jgi:hypothetical protein